MTDDVLGPRLQSGASIAREVYIRRHEACLGKAQALNFEAYDRVVTDRAGLMA